MKNRTAFVILNFNGWRDTVKCLDSVFGQSCRNFRVILIDNGSKDESVKKLGAIKNSRLTFIKNKENSGFAGGVNIGIKWAMENQYEHVVLLNNDAHIEKDWLKKLLEAQDKNQSAITTGLLLSADGQKIDDAGDFYTTWGVPMLRAEFSPRAKAPKSSFIFGATGGAVMYKTELFNDIGLFDEKFFAYDEDVDVSFRAQLAGYKCYYERGAVAYHKHSATSKKMPGLAVYQLFKNLPMLYLKNVPSGMLFSTGVKLFLLYWLFFIYRLFRGDGWSALKGAIASFGLYPHALTERRRIQKTKKVSTKYIKSIIYHGLPLRSVRRIRQIFGLKEKDVS
ncbi:MAG: glycosyltransferase family 2 protein [Candidatus Nomurabacteria bacterium]|jgi:GT2 family glycosyltransferase|nr:glycosyltransferase family 2 protein [Candidatus Nomurabacteria bacterium]